MKRLLIRNVVVALSIAPVALSLATAQLKPPVARKVDQTDTYFGVTVADPYRWLEDDNSAETAQWVEAENKVTFDYLSKIPFREGLRKRLEALYNYPKYSAPFRKGEYYFYYKNDGLQNQSVLYRQQGLSGAPEVIIDPNVLSPDGTTRLTNFVLSKDGAYAAYGIARSGSDWQDYCVMKMESKQTFPDTLHWIKASGVSWLGRGFFYSRYAAPEPGKELTSKNENQKVFYHVIGEPQSRDKLIYEDPSHPQRFNGAVTSEDEKFVFLVVSERGKGLKGNSLYYREAAAAGSPFLPIIDTIGNDRFNVVDNDGASFLIQTDRGAPNGKVVLFNPAAAGQNRWRDILPERAEPLQGAGTAGGKLFVTYMKDVISKSYVYSLSGKLEHEIELPGPGTASGFGGERGDESVFYTYTSFNAPPTIYRYDIAARRSTVFRTSEIPGFDPSAYTTEEVFYHSKDGTRVPMFLVYRKGLKRDGTNPTLLYGYGGFNISIPPSFSSLRLALLEQGFIYASANLRGGNEYGEQWHEAGTKLNKQHVFDDFIAAAEWLIEQKYTSKEHLAIQGGSNGGLLVGAVMNQRPDLFKVAIPQVGVMDMLRFHKFTIGWNWIPDYGSSDNEAEFKALYAYSPLQNIRAGVSYPATLITTADHDDRVVPAHSFKYAATLQEKNSGPNPILIRIETKSGHGASSVTKSIEVTADIYAFIMKQLGMNPSL